MTVGAPECCCRVLCVHSARSELQKRLCRRALAYWRPRAERRFRAAGAAFAAEAGAGHSSPAS